MSELLLELFSEEIPARLQTRAAEDLRRLMVDGLKARGLEVGEARAFATPRRLALVIEGVPKKSPAVSEEKKGPRVGAPEQAIAGFLKGAGLASLDEAQIVKDEKKGDFYVARIDKPGRAAAEIVNEALREAILNFPGRRRCASTPSSTTAPSCAGSGRCIRSCCCSTARWCRSRSPASNPARKRAAIASSATNRSR